MQQVPLSTKPSILQLAIVFALTAGMLALFRALPELDMFVSRLAFSSTACEPGTVSKICGDFLLQNNKTFIALRKFNLNMINFFAMAAIGLVLFQLFFTSRTTGDDLRKSALVIGTLILATGVLVNLVLKNSWGRPRPFKVDQLGGDLPFVLPGTFSSYCDTNCSFVSGEASSAAWLLTFLLFIPGLWRWVAGLVLMANMIFFSGLRVAFGRHFLSDVVMSVLFTLCVFMALQALFSHPKFQVLFEKLARWSNQLAFVRRRK